MDKPDGIRGGGKPAEAHSMLLDSQMTLYVSRLLHRPDLPVTFTVLSRKGGKLASVVLLPSEAAELGRALVRVASC